MKQKIKVTNLSSEELVNLIERIIPERLGDQTTLTVNGTTVSVFSEDTVDSVLEKIAAGNKQPQWRSRLALVRGALATTLKEESAFLWDFRKRRFHPLSFALGAGTVTACALLGSAAVADSFGRFLILLFAALLTLVGMKMLHSHTPPENDEKVPPSRTDQEGA